MDCFINYKNKIYKEEDFKEFIQEQLNSINNSGLNIKWDTNQTLEEKIKVIDFFNMENFFHTTASEKRGDLKQGLDNFIHLGTEKTAQEIFEKKTNFKGEIHKIPNRFKNTNIVVLNNLESNYDPFESDSTSTVQQILRLRYREPKATEKIKEFNKAENKKEWVAQEFNNITFVYFNKIEGFNEVSIAVTDSLEDGFTIYSGAADGADTYWASVANEYNLRVKNYLTNDFRKIENLIEKNNIELQYKETAKFLGRGVILLGKPGSELVRRDMLQANSADRIIAVTRLIPPGVKGQGRDANKTPLTGYVNKMSYMIPDGGTGYAVARGILSNKDTYVFNYTTDYGVPIGWYKWDNNNFIPTDTPILTQHTAGIGTRELEENGKKAIQDVFQKTFTEVKGIKNIFTTKINQFNYTLNTSTGEVIHNTKTKGDIVETNPLQINKVYVEYAKSINSVIKEFNDSQYIKIFNKVINIKNANEVTQKQILDLFENNISIQVSNEEYIDKKFEVKSKSKSSITYENLNNGQKQAYNEIVEFLNDSNRKTHSLIGYAGTGKTTMLNLALEKAPFEVVFSTPTHKANNVLRQKNPYATIKTIQSLLGLKPNFDLENFDANTLEFEQVNNIKPPKILVIDEASMINDELYDTLVKELVNKHGTKILFVGDNAQLQPVKQEAKSKALDSTEKISSLTEVMRADNDSLLRESMLTRETGSFSYTTNLTPEGKGVKYTSDKNEFIEEAIQAFKSESFKSNKSHVRVLSATNRGVDDTNDTIRKALYGENSPELVEGELLMAYTNALEGKISNSGDYEIHSIENSTKVIGDINFNGYSVELIDSSNPKEPLIETFIIGNNNSKEKFIELAETIEKIRLQAQVTRKWKPFFDITESFTTLVDIKTRDGITKVKSTFKYGYSHTIHKSQGGTYKNIFILDNTIEKFPTKDSRAQLRYVGITRAESKATIYSPNKTSGDGNTTEKIKEEVEEVKQLVYKPFNSKDKDFKIGSVVNINGKLDLVLRDKSFALNEEEHILLLENGKIPMSQKNLLEKNVTGNFPVLHIEEGNFIIGSKEIYDLDGNIIEDEILKNKLRNLAQKDIAKQMLKNQFDSYGFAQIHKNNRQDKPIIEAAKEIVVNKLGYSTVEEFEKMTGEIFSLEKYFTKEEKEDRVIIKIINTEDNKPKKDFMSLFSSGSNPLEARPNIGSFYNDTKIFEC